MKINNNKSKKRLTYILRTIIVIILIVFAIVEIYPFVWMIISGFKTSDEMLLNSFGLPKAWNFMNYVKAWKNGVSSYYVNSIIVTTISTIVTILLSSFAAFALARIKFKHSRVVLMFILCGLMLAPMVSLIPLYKMLTSLHLYNTYSAMIIPYVSFQIPFTVFLLWSNFLDIPKDIEESAIIDGCSSIRVLFSIILPIAKPMVVTSAILAGRYTWNEMLFALCFVESSKLKTIPIGLLSLRSQTATDWPVLVAGLTISALPIIVLFIVLQKHIVRGMTAGGVKG